MKELLNKILGCGGAVPTRYASNGEPKADDMIDSTKLYTKATKAQVVHTLETTAAAGLVYYRRDIQRVALTPDGLAMVAVPAVPGRKEIAK